MHIVSIRSAHFLRVLMLLHDFHILRVHRNPGPTNDYISSKSVSRRTSLQTTVHEWSSAREALYSIRLLGKLSPPSSPVVIHAVLTREALYSIRLLGKSSPPWTPVVIHAVLTN